MKENLTLIEYKKQETYGLISAIEALLRAIKESLLIEEHLRREIEDNGYTIEEMQEHIDELVAKNKRSGGKYATP